MSGETFNVYALKGMDSPCLLAHAFASKITDLWGFYKDPSNWPEGTQAVLLSKGSGTILSWMGSHPILEKSLPALRVMV